MSWNIEYLKGKGFDANPQNINRAGRPRKQLSIILSEVQELGYKRPSDSEIVEICWLMLSLSEDELKRIESWDEFPMVMKIIASRLLSNRWFETVEKILDRIYGKTINNWKPLDDKVIEIVFKDDFPMTDAQMLKITEEYLKKKGLQITTL